MGFHQATMLVSSFQSSWSSVTTGWFGVLLGGMRSLPEHSWGEEHDSFIGIGGGWRQPWSSVIRGDWPCFLGVSIDFHFKWLHKSCTTVVYGSSWYSIYPQVASGQTKLGQQNGTDHKKQCSLWGLGHVMIQTTCGSEFPVVRHVLLGWNLGQS